MFQCRSVLQGPTLFGNREERMGIRGKSSPLSRARERKTETGTAGSPLLVYDARRNIDPFLSLVYESLEDRRQLECQWEWSHGWKTGRVR